MLKILDKRDLARDCFAQRYFYCREIVKSDDHLLSLDFETDFIGFFMHCPGELSSTTKKVSFVYNGIVYTHRNTVVIFLKATKGKSQNRISLKQQRFFEK